MSAYSFTADERPTSLGAPYLPRVTVRRRIVYAGVGTFIGAMTTFPNALTNTNITTISGSLDLYVAEASWLPALYFGMNASSNLVLIKARAQWGIPQITAGLLLLYALAAAIQLAWPSFATVAVARAVNGIESGALVTLAVYYLLVAFPGKFRPLALLIGVSLTQFGTPLARMVPVELLGADHWQGMHCLELAVPLAVLATILLAPLPPSERTRAFEWTDLLSIALLLPGILLGCEVLSLGRVLWWSDTPLLGDLLAACVVFLALGCIVEINRERPLLQLRWLSTVNIARFVGIAVLMRLALAEQTFGSVGLLSASGLNNDQLHTLFCLVALSMLAGIVAAVLTLREERLPWQVMAAALCIALGALLDSHSNNLTRPEQLYVSQCLVGFGTTLFIGPVILYGFLQMMRSGAEHFITIVVVFSITQNVGALAGSAIMGSYQVARAHVHTNDLIAQLIGADPQVADRIAHGATSTEPIVGDSVLRLAEGGSLLATAVGREATVLAFGDTYLFLACLAGGTAAFVALSLLFKAYRRAPTIVATPA